MRRSLNLALFVCGVAGLLACQGCGKRGGDATQINAGGSSFVPVQMRMMAIVHAAIFDAVNSIERKYTPYEVEASAAPGASPEAAGAAAAHGILERLFPPQKAMIDAALAASLKDIAEGPAKTEGLRVGREVAEKLFALRKDDGAAAQAPYEFGKADWLFVPREMLLIQHWS